MERAIEVALSDEFLHYYAALYGKQSLLSGKEMKSKLKFQRVPYRKLVDYGITMSPPPPPDSQFMLYEYYDVDNYAFHILEGCTHHVSPRHEFLQLLVNNFAEELQLLSLLRMAKTDADRILFLKTMRGGVPIIAEWLERDLVAFEKQTSLADAVATELKATLKLVRDYIDDPTMRALPASTNVQLK